MRESEFGPLPSLSSPAFGRFGLDIDPLGEVVGEARLTAPTTRLAKRTGLLEESVRLPASLATMNLLQWARATRPESAKTCQPSR